jgi:hypothetical protein
MVGQANALEYLARPIDEYNQRHGQDNIWARGGARGRVVVRVASGIVDGMSLRMGLVVHWGVDHRTCAPRRNLARG